MDQQILKFWFEEIRPKQWWVKDEAFDQLIRDRFFPLHRQAAGGELYSWRQSATGRLAEILILDQFSRNMFRGTPAAFAQDALALVLAQEAVAWGCDRQLPQQQRAFLYLPYMHSESALIHQVALKLFEQLGLQSSLDYEIKHKAIIERFGRYPHRNRILGRESTAAERAFLQQPGSSF
jgi:uncharacterized protein (DUF924 family)